jgi:hypothetical protein
MDMRVACNATHAMPGMYDPQVAAYGAAASLKYASKLLQCNCMMHIA